MPFKLSKLNSNLALTLGCFNPALNNSAQYDNLCIVTPRHSKVIFHGQYSGNMFLFLKWAKNILFPSNVV